MRAYLSGLVVAFALLASQPAAAATCYDQCGGQATCCNYQAIQYWDSCTYTWSYYWAYAPANYQCTQYDWDTGAAAGGGTYTCTTGATYNCNPHWCPDPVEPDLVQWYVSLNYSTGDWSFDVCGANAAGYTRAAAIQAYRSGDGSTNPEGIVQNVGYAAGIGTTWWPVNQTYMCQRWVNLWNSNGGYYWKSDNFVSTDPNCKGYSKVMAYNAAGAYVQAKGPAFLQGAYEGSKNRMMYLCLMPAQSQGGGTNWSEFRVSDNCSGGTLYEYLGYARLDQTPAANQANGQLNNTECSQANCVGQCGKDCDGVLGFHVNTSACMAHDQCVCNHNNNIWAWECLGDFALAAVSYVIAVVETIIESIIEAIGNALEALWDFLFGWL